MPQQQDGLSKRSSLSVAGDLLELQITLPREQFVPEMRKADSGAALVSQLLPSRSSTSRPYTHTSDYFALRALAEGLGPEWASACLQFLISRARGTTIKSYLDPAVTVSVRDGNGQELARVEPKNVAFLKEFKASAKAVGDLLLPFTYQRINGAYYRALHRYVVQEEQRVRTAVYWIERGTSITETARRIGVTPLRINHWMTEKVVPRVIRSYAPGRELARHPIKIPASESVDFAEFLGAACGAMESGSFHGDLKVSHPRRAVAKAEADALARSVRIRVPVHRSKTGRYYYRVKSEDLSESLNQATDCNRHVPWQHLVTQQERIRFVRAFLRRAGGFKASGSTGEYLLNSSNGPFIRDFAQVLNLLGIYPVVPEDSKNGRVYVAIRTRPNLERLAELELLEGAGHTRLLAVLRKPLKIQQHSAAEYQAAMAYRPLLNTKPAAQLYRDFCEECPKSDVSMEHFIRWLKGVDAPPKIVQAQEALARDAATRPDYDALGHFYRDRELPLARASELASPSRVKLDGVPTPYEIGCLVDRNEICQVIERIDRLAEPLFATWTKENTKGVDLPVVEADPICPVARKLRELARSLSLVSRFHPEILMNSHRTTKLDSLRNRLIGVELEARLHQASIELHTSLIGLRQGRLIVRKLLKGQTMLQSRFLAHRWMVGGEARVQKRLQANLDTVEEIVSRYKTVEGAERHFVSGARLLSELPFNLTLLQKIFREVHKYEDRAVELTSGQFQSKARRRFVRLTGQAPREYLRHLERVRECLAEYHAVRSFFATYNTPFLRSQAKQITQEEEAISDLIQEGSQFLLRSADVYCWRSQPSFVARSTRWVSDRMRRHLWGGLRGIAVPPKTQAAFWEIENFMIRAKEESAIVPTREAIIARLVELEFGDLEEAAAIYSQWLTHGQEFEFRDYDRSGGRDSSIGMPEEMAEELWSAFDRVLSPDEQTVLKHTVLDAGDPDRPTLGAIAKLIGVDSDDAVIELRNSALDKLKSSLTSTSGLPAEYADQMALG